MGDGTAGSRSASGMTGHGSQAPDGRTEAEVTRKVRDLERARDTGRLASLGKGLTAGQWMEIWLTTIAPRRIRRSTLESTYKPKVRNRIIPGLGKHRLDRLTPEHIERFYTRLDAEGLAPATVLQIHRILSRALKVGMQRGYVARNVATLVDAPSASPGEIEPLTPAEAQRLVALAMTRRNGSRWSVAVALGLRQGEALGPRWQYVDLDASRSRSGGSFGASAGATAAATRPRVPRIYISITARPAAPATPVRARSGQAAASTSPS